MAENIEKVSLWNPGDPDQFEKVTSGLIREQDEKWLVKILYKKLDRKKKATPPNFYEKWFIYVTDENGDTYEGVVDNADYMSRYLRLRFKKGKQLPYADTHSPKSAITRKP